MMRLLAIALFGATVGCATVTSTGGGGGGGDAPAGKSPFPTRETLDKIGAAPAPQKLTGDKGVEADGWQLSGPLPDALELTQYSDGSPWQALLESAVASRAGLVALPASMHCVARETGLFFLAKRALPADRLAQFIAARCGAFAPDLRVGYLSGEIPSGVAPERVVEQYRESIMGDLQKMLKGGAQLAGIWFGQQGRRAVVMISVASRKANLDPLAIVPAADGSFVVRGEVLEPTEHIEALFNRGHYGFGRCVADPSVPLPRFAVSCKVDPEDALSWVEIVAFPAGRILGPVVARFVVFPSGAPTVSCYHDAAYVNRKVPAGADAREQLLALLNEVRRGAGLSEVTLAVRQSAVAERVAPHYFAALAGSEPELVADEVALGLRAGWDVDGEVRLGQFTAGALAKSDDLGRLLDAVLERPSGREALLGRASRLVAIGAVVAPEQQVVGMVASSYELFEGDNHAADAQRVRGRLTKARLDRHVAPPAMLSWAQGDLQEGAARVQRGESKPLAALNRMIERSAERVPGVMVRGWVLEASSLDDVTFPPQLLAPGIGGVAVAVTHYRPKGAPWSRLVIFILAASGDGTTSAMREHWTL